MSKPKQWKQGRDVKRYDAWDAALPASELQSCVANGRLQLNDAYPEEAEQPDRLWVGTGAAGVVS